MKQSWITNTTAERSLEIRKDFISSLTTRRRLEELLSAKITASNASSRSKDNYSNPSWAYLQADAVGYERALFEVISLISDKNVEKA